MAKRKRPPSPPVTTRSAKKARDDRASRRAAAQDIRDQARRDQITTLNAVNSPLLRLPAELRNMIFTHVYTGMNYDFDGIDEGSETKPSDRYCLIAGDGRWLEQRTPDKLHLACRQMHAEMALLPYSLGRFHFAVETSGFQGLWTMKGFLGRRTSEQTDAMANVQLSEWSKALKCYWYQRNTAAHWVAKLEVLSASVAKMTPMERSNFDISSLGPRGGRATLSQTG
ncbi:hypothetical protein J4E85_009188 [Alternaria conjuncta]|uniref:uncharacterized protein n=1 Tax=Alternaria conjuncta TaxID=181017 RepID=UPI0022205D08|nr:uncharacterized protein J4E85_009188 [Alternaria conjuncta]KAI4920421.1 hypothetical protein J4E85_009188 [Alternaria conjuncta]